MKTHLRYILDIILMPQCIKSNQIKFIYKCKNSAHGKHVMHLGDTARRIALTAAQCYSFIYK